MSNVLVSNGNIGMAVAALLARQGHHVGLMVRKPPATPGPETPGILPVVADAARPETLTAAFEGVDAFFFVSPLVENMPELAIGLLNAARKAGVQHLVRSSARGASIESPTIMGKLHGQVEELIKQSGMAYTIVQPASFFQNILGSLGSIKAERTFYGSAGDGQNAYVDVRDIAAVAATAIAEGTAHTGKTYVVTGSELLSNGDMARILSSVLGVPITYTDLPPRQLGEMYLSYGMSKWTVDALLELDQVTKEGYVAKISKDVQKVTGKAPIRFETFVQENQAAFK